MSVVEVSKKKSSTAIYENRIWELDFLKGLAFVFMVWDHTVFDLHDFFGCDTSSLGFFRDGIGTISAVIFMTVCGISVTLGKNSLKHCAKVFSLALALTAFTLLFDCVTGSDVCIKFGILHFLGAAMLIGHFAKKLPRAVNAVLAVGSAALGIWFRGITTSVPFLFPIGITASDFSSGDYFPLFPNLFYVFCGIIIGKTLYKQRKSLIPFRLKKSFLCFLGRHTLLLYFIHQPVILALLWVMI